MRAGRPGDAVIVTGASRGIGLGIAVGLARRGFTVWAGVRDANDAPSVRAAARAAGATIAVLPLDVTSPASVQAALQTVIDACERVYAVINNAGMTWAGYFEDVTDAEVRQVLDVNFFGALNVTRCALPVMRAAGGGRVVMVSSYCGRIGTVAAAPYVASKFALEGWAESLSLEVRPFDIDITLLEPGVVPTRLLGEGRRVAAAAADPRSPYHAWFRRAEQEADALVASARLKVEDVAAAAARVLLARRPPLRTAVCRRAAMLLWLRRRLPDEWFERVYFGEMLRRVTGSRSARLGRV